MEYISGNLSINKSDNVTRKNQGTNCYGKYLKIRLGK